MLTQLREGVRCSAGKACSSRANRSARGRLPLGAHVEVALAQAVDLEPQVVVFVGLTDPLHTDPLCGGCTACVPVPDHREQLLDARAERVMRDGVPRLGGQTTPPGTRGQLPGDLQ